jgi:hypothetical protein
MIRAGVNEFAKVIRSVADGTQPAAAYGTSVTPGNNSYGSYASVIAGASVTDDVFGIYIQVCANTTSTAARDTILTIGLDPAGGTSFTDTINHLLVSCAGLYFGAASGPGVSYFFPLFIKAGTSIGAKASVNNATVGTLRCSVRLLCQPSRPELVRVGSFVTTFGDTVASSTGTAVTAGTASEGTYTQLGSALASPLWFWQLGVGANSGTMENNALHADLGLGDASNKRTIITNDDTFTTSAEALIATHVGAYANGATGDLVYGRLQHAGSGAYYSMMAYGVGG